MKKYISLKYSIISLMIILIPYIFVALIEIILALIFTRVGLEGYTSFTSSLYSFIKWFFKGLSGAERLLAGSYYNVRVDECKSAAFITNSYLEVYKKFKDTYLRDLNYEDFLKYEKKMPKNFAKRAHHFYNECDRVKRGEKAWAKGDIIEFGKIVSESGKSSIDMYEAGSPLLIDLYNIMVNTKGVYGSRFMGGGFNGACLAIIDPAYEKEVMENIKNEYSKLHPEYANKVNLFAHLKME